MTQLSVNINKFATLRNARGNNKPCLIDVTKDILRFGAKSITLHPRPDERHITRQDAIDVAKLLSEPAYEAIEYNIEGYPSTEFLDLIFELKPHQYTLVPDPPEALTSNAGWSLPKTQDALKPILSRLKDSGIRSSLFINPLDVDMNFLKSLKELKPDRIELYTEKFAHDFNTPNQPQTIKLYKETAQKISELGIDLNAGHDLNLENLGLLLKNIPQCLEVSIGHALVCESLYLGLKTCIDSYLKILGPQQ